MIAKLIFNGSGYVKIFFFCVKEKNDKLGVDQKNIRVKFENPDLQ